MSPRSGSRAARRLRHAASGLLLAAFATVTWAAGEIPGWPAARSAYDARRYGEARQRFRELEAGHPELPELQFFLGRLALWFDDGDEARTRLEGAAHRAPDDARLQNALGDAYGWAANQGPLHLRLRRADQCRQAYERAVQLEPANPAYRWSLLGFHLVAPWLAGGRLAEAKHQADELRRLDPAAGRAAWATIHLATKNSAAAFAEFEPVVQAEPDNFLALFHLGRCAALSGERLERGRQALQRCLTLNAPAGDGAPGHAAVHHRLGNILEKLGQPAAAEAEYAAARGLEPDFRPAKVALRN